jgi:hypothetical protein
MNDRASPNLWRVSHRISGEQLKSVIGDPPHTPLAAVVAATLRDLGHRG